MLIQMAWRNTWRNRIRSAVVICALALGIWAGLFVSAFVHGMMQQKIDSVIDMELSHVQLHARGFRDDFSVSLTIPGAAGIRDGLLAESSVMGVSARTVGFVMLSTARASGGIRLSGIVPDEERVVTHLDGKVAEGGFLDKGKRNPLLISEETAKKYEATIGSKMVLTFQDKDGEIVAAAFRVNGIYRTGNTMYDAANAFARREDVQALAGLGDSVHELAVLLRDNSATDSLVKKYQGLRPDLEVLSWMDLSPGMRYMVGVIDMYTVIIMSIVLLALLFSIINTMLMAVLDRVRELGMLMAVGMSRRRIFSMILIETFFLALVATPAGLFLAWASVTWFGHAGINLGDAAYGDLGYSNIIYPALDAPEYLKVTTLVLVMALLAALYPARKALSLKPVDAIRKI